MVGTYFLAIPKADFNMASVLNEVVLNLITFESLDREASSSKMSFSSSESASACYNNKVI